MQLEDFTPGDTILVNRSGLVTFSATVTGVRSIPDSQGRRHEYVDFTPNAPHENLVYRYAVLGDVLGVLSRRTAVNDPLD